MIRLSHTPDFQKPALLCVAGNLCDPSVAFERITPPGDFQKLYVHYFDSPGPWDMETLGQELAHLLQQFTSAPVVLAGYSAGGVLCISAASKNPERISGLVLSNTGPCSKGHGSPQFAQELKEHFDDENYIRRFLSSCFYQPIPKEVEDRLWNYTRTIPPEAGYEVSLSLRQMDYRESLKAYKGPAAVIHGQLDTRRKMDSVEMICDSLPQAQVTLLQTGHTPMWEDAAGYEKALETLLKRIN
ncbi:MAG TPA: alpha/beta hydrolase [Candidatus Enterocloster faecavium]|uniref:Alpha/beta hydrolase n=1 Tax=Candidatus Enterocloster faecavium TaxID=2838560 RepID=A0A9D2L7N3_9FIRM|nr:alpha/beta hydrolase [Candidatus Enterocloster faecavium]